MTQDEALKAAQDAYYEAREHYAIVYGTYKGASEQLKKAIDIYRAELTRINQNYQTDYYIEDFDPDWKK